MVLLSYGTRMNDYKNRVVFNGGDWTESRFNSFIKGGLRSISKRWGPRYQCLNNAEIGKKINVKTGRLAKHYTCNCCKGEFVAADVQVDHISPIIDPEIGFESWDSIIHNMFCEADNLQVLCKTCHADKSNKERQIAKQRRKVRSESDQG